jgi:hypothetical protein
MPTQFGINGFGRIGRLVMRAALDNPGKQTWEASNQLKREKSFGVFIEIFPSNCLVLASWVHVCFKPK